jgi:hypothetical protein
MAAVATLHRSTDDRPLRTAAEAVFAAAGELYCPLGVMAALLQHSRTACCPEAASLTALAMVWHRHQQHHSRKGAQLQRGSTPIGDSGDISGERRAVALLSALRGAAAGSWLPQTHTFADEAGNPRKVRVKPLPALVLVVHTSVALESVEIWGDCCRELATNCFGISEPLF